MEKDFKFALGDRVKLVESDETGEIIGRAEYLTNPFNYYIRYRAGDGRQTTCWWEESHIEKVG